MDILQVTNTNVYYTCRAPARGHQGQSTLQETEGGEYSARPGTAHTGKRHYRQARHIRHEGRFFEQDINAFFPCWNLTPTSTNNIHRV